MDIEVQQESMTALPEYGRIPMSFEVDRVLDVEIRGAGFILSERDLDIPYVKDYDTYKDEGPANWEKHFDLSKWGLIAARATGRLVGGAVIAFNTPGVYMLEGRSDLAVLWDIRISPEVRGQGIGARVFQAAEIWAAERGCRQLKIETQNTNVPACRFYAQRGCILKTIDRFAYPELPHEIQMLWYKELSAKGSYDLQKIT